MRRNLQILVAFILGMCIPMLMVFIAFLAAPRTIDANDEIAVIRGALSIPTVATGGRTLTYLKASGADVLLPDLRKMYPRHTFRDGLDRPIDEGCKSTRPDLIILAPCLRDDFVSVKTLTYPFWNVAIVAVDWSYGGGQITLIKWFGTWRVVSQKLAYV